MQFPRKVRIVRRVYGVHVVAKLPRRRSGWVDYHERTITLADRSPSRRYTPAEMRDSFWHEAVHALLHGLQEYRLRDNERFVTRFASALSKMIDSARF